MYNKTNSSSFFYFMLFIIFHTICTRFYFLYDLDALAKDIILIISLIIVLSNINKLKIVLQKDDKFIYIFFLYSFCTSCIMAIFNFNQPIEYSILASRILVSLIILFIALNFLIKKINLIKLYKVSFVIAIFISLFSFYMYLTSDFSLVYKDTTHAFRFDNVRISIAPETLAVLIFFFFYNGKNNRISYFPFILLLLTLVFVNQTRAMLLAVLLVLSLSFINLNKRSTLYTLFSLTLITILSIIFSNFESSIFAPLINIYENTMNEVSSGSGNVNVRALELNYFWNFLDIKSMIFGFGMDNNRFIDIYHDYYYLSDLGIFKVFYLYGIIGLILFTLIYYQLYKISSKANTPIHNTGKALVLFQVFAPTLNILNNLEGVFIFFTVYILVKQYNIRNGLNG